MKICEEKYKQLPDNLKALFVKLPNPGSDEVVGLFPQTKSGAMHGVYKNTMMKGQPGIRDGKEVLLHQEASEGSAARFFKSIETDECSLCCLTLPQKHDTIKEKTKGDASCHKLAKSVLNAEKSSGNTKAIIENIVPLNVEDLLVDKLVHFVKYVANLCDICAIDIVQSLVAISEAQKDVPSQQGSQVILDFIGDYRKCILLQNLANYVEHLDNIDTTQTTKSLLKLFGCVNPAITNFIQETRKLEPKRFLYQAKASKAERGEGNNHPTVKPLKLMCYLCRLVTPPGGTVLDCYVGSGTTGVAAQIEGFGFIGIDKDIDIAARRIERHRVQGNLFIMESKEKQRAHPEKEKKGFFE